MITREKNNLMERIVLSNQNKLKELENSKKLIGKKLLEYLYQRPMINSQFVEEYLHLSANKAENLLQDFLKLGIIKEISSNKNTKIYAFNDYLSLFNPVN